MKRRTGFTLIELLVVIAIIAILAAILFPVFSRVRKSAFASNCQSNMKQIGTSVKMYLTDWDDTFPTNRRRADTAMVYEIQLSPAPAAGSTDEPEKFYYGTNWVEGLYSYIERVAGKNESSSVWRCQSTRNIQYGPIAGVRNHASVNYAFNGYFAEQPEGVVKTASNTMMVRELDRMMNAEFRPHNGQMHNPLSGAGVNGVRPAIGTDDDKPIDPFLTTSDEMVTGTVLTNKLHAKGSHILFADGHVKFYTTTYMPMNSEVIVANSWDTKAEQWYNFKGEGGTAPVVQQKSIGITP